MTVRPLSRDEAALMTVLSVSIPRLQLVRADTVTALNQNTDAPRRHFCYACGQGIVQSIRRDELQREISRHYRKCTFIQVNIPDRGMPP